MVSSDFSNIYQALDQTNFFLKPLQIQLKEGKIGKELQIAFYHSIHPFLD